MFDDYQDIAIARDGNILRVTLNRPDQLNAVNERLHGEMARLFVDISADHDSDVVILTGAGRAFCAGGDLKFLETCLADQAAFAATLHEGKRIVMSMLDCDKPIICRLNGDAMGLGATLALFCDIIVADERANIADPHVLVGLTAGDGGAVIWPQLIGYARAKQYLLSGDAIPAPDAAALGLINFAVSAEELDRTVDKWAKKLASGAGRAIRSTKATVNIPLKQIAASVMEAGLAGEGRSVLTEDFGEAVAAFRDKRRPVFKGR
jgi:enoyl-CoA hydratase